MLHTGTRETTDCGEYEAAAATTTAPAMPTAPAAGHELFFQRCLWCGIPDVFGALVVRPDGSDGAVSAGRYDERRGCVGTQYDAPDERAGIGREGVGRGALAGLRIADFSRVLAGPYATMLLADLGAEVVKVERPGAGDETRAWHPPADHDGTSTYFLSVNRNKKSVALDLTTEAGLEQARALVAESDVLVENFRPGTMERLGLGPRELRARHPGLVYCSISGFGSGAGAAIPGYDLLVQAASRRAGGP